MDVLNPRAGQCVRVKDDKDNSSDSASGTGPP